MAIMLLHLVLSAALWCVPGDSDARTSDEDHVKRAANRIDELVEGALAEAGQRPNSRTDDATFARRAYLEIAGRIPSATELEAFLDQKGSKKRGELIDLLLDSAGHKSTMFNYWSDILRVRSKVSNQVSGTPYVHWLKQSISENMPYDDMVREMLTAEGPAHERDNGATGYYMRDRGMPEDNMSNTMRVFLGTRFECAQCHNHPFDQWTQREYFEMVAFTGGIEYRGELRDIPNAPELLDLRRGMRGSDGQSAKRRALQRLLRPTLAGVGGSGTGLVKLPDDYQYDDAEPEQWIAAKPAFGDVDLEVEMPSDKVESSRRPRKRAQRIRKYKPEEIDSREVFADWLTSPENSRFTMVIANRMWGRVMGVPLIDPVDDIKSDTKPTNPELMAALEDLMVAVDYDLQSFLRVLYNTDTWQRESCAVDTNEGFLFAGPKLERMTAEQAWDSVLTLILDDVDGTIDVSGARQAEQAYERHERVVNATGEELRETVDLLSLRYSDPDAFRRQAARKKREEQAAKAAAKAEARPLLRQLRRARRQGDKEAEQKLIDQLTDMGVSIPGAKLRKTLVRASEVGSPAPDGHFLRQFGQSDRDQIEASHTDANIPQILARLNGQIEEGVVQNEDAAIHELINSAQGPKAQIEVAFLAILGRKPTKKEVALWKPDVRDDSEVAIGDLIWTLLNTHEFLFVR